MTHPHADILRAIADGKPIEARCTTERATKDRDRDWIIPADVLGMIADPVVLRNWELRIKPETMTLAGHEFPEPVRKSLKYGTPYFMVSVGDAPYTEHKWRGHQHDHKGLQHGLIQLTAEGAIAQAKAMIAAVGGEV